MKMKQSPVLRFALFLLLVLVLGYFAVDGDITGSVVSEEPLPQTGRVELRFCQLDDCAAFLMEELLAADSAKCAFYDLDYEPLEAVLEAHPDLELLVFEEYYEGLGTEVGAAHGGLMHNKFCILDRGTPAARIITGSTNPTENGFEKNDNHLILIEGMVIVENYVQEFEEIAGGREKEVPTPLIMQTDLNGNTFLIENYFCPEDKCEAQVLEELKAADESIQFMTFSFTSDPIGELLVKKHQEGVAVTGVFEKRQNSRYSEYAKLEAAGIPVQFDTNKQTMHHKVFIIDAGREDAVVILGSYNPTKNGNTRNDENLLIIHELSIAQQFHEEFVRVSN
jgi:phosphatidylserine/phosphatidylglycerophosphate/cardiolipin synthase-like enzyme